MSPEELRALDVRVAEARGWTWYAYSYYEDGLPRRTFVAPEDDEQVRAWGWMRAAGEEPIGERPFSTVPRYSTDPAASRVLLDEMAEGIAEDATSLVEILWLSNGCSSGSFTGPGYFCLVWADSGEHFGGPCDTLDAAICLAWLQWKEAQAE